MPDRRSAELLAVTCAAVADAIGRHMPAGRYRDFSAWAFSAENPHQGDYLRATGITQLVNMNHILLEGLVPDSGWPVMLHYTGLMNAYQVFEVISDNLAIGLGPAVLDEGGRERRELVSRFNHGMIRALEVDYRAPAVLLLGLAQGSARAASGFRQSLAAGVHAQVAEEYVRSAGGTVEELDHGLWAALVTNVECCRELVEALAGMLSEPLVRQGLLDRYRAVERGLQAVHLPRLELGTLGAQSILVGPTLGFVIGILVERVEPLSGYPEVLLDGLLGDLLADVALLVRLHNDIGGALLRLAPEQQRVLLTKLAGQGDPLTVLALLGAEPNFARLHKDVINSEFNVALWHARRAVDEAGAWQALAESLAYFSALFAQHSKRLAAGLAELDRRLGDPRAGAVIERFLRFHERMYAHLHTEQVGEYAI